MRLIKSEPAIHFEEAINYFVKQYYIGKQLTSSMKIIGD